ncbi:MAG: fumarylacetoacetate hydrolase family protein [Thermoleophilia bacterium]|nr:fumarylacetoacetate hydrolase family protein [Thermoleophilia bacterium]
MRLVTYALNGESAVGVKLPGGVADSGYSSMLDLIRGGEPALERVRRRTTEAERSGSLIRPERILAPIPRPGKLLFAYVNFYSVVEAFKDVDLVEEISIPQAASFFSKLPTSVIGPGDAVVKPYPDCELDYSVELGVVIGKTAKKIGPENALEYVFGYTVCHDVSARDIELRRNPWFDTTFGKGCDTFCVLGPEIVLRDEIPDPSRLHLSSSVNGEPRQSESAAGMIFDVQHQIAAITEFVTLEPGDIVSGGTPAEGLGMLMDPPRWLEPGDEVTVEIDRIGKLTNPVAAGW